jgi:8-oxo-dGTP diphosphatase
MSRRTSGTGLTRRRWPGTSFWWRPAAPGCAALAIATSLWAMPTQIVVAGAVISGATLLVAQRDRPPALAGRWELPGGKVAAGETERDALVRELVEELGLEAGDVVVGDRLGADIAISDTMTLRAYRVRLTRGEPRAHDHRALRWVAAAELDDVDWVPADREWLPDLARAL